MSPITIETEYPNIHKLVDLCMIDYTGNCLSPSADELKHIFSPMLELDSDERDMMAGRLVIALDNLGKDQDISAVADGIWKKRQEEIFLNEQLYNESIKDEIDFIKVEDLLKKGANPLDIFDYEFFETVFTEVVNDRESKAELIELTKLFLRYGMDVGSMKRDCLHTLTWLRNQYGFEIVKMIFDTKIDWLDVEAYISDMLGDMWQFDYFDISDNDSIEGLFWAIREAMYLAALVANDIEKCEWVYKVIRPDLNNRISLKEFVNWNAFEYEYIVNDNRDNYDEGRLSGNTIVIKRKDSKEVVWEINFVD